MDRGRLLGSITRNQKRKNEGMKQWISICLIVILLCTTGCQKKKISSQKMQAEPMGEEFILGQDDQPNYNSSSICPIAIEDGYYIQMDRMEYLDWKSKEIVPVCNKAECEHKPLENCNAYNNFSGDTYMYYGGYMYCIDTLVKKDGSQGQALCRIKKDGTDKEKLYDMFALSEDAADDGIALLDCIHRGYIYYAVERLDTETEKTTATVYRRKLEKNASAEKVFEKTAYAMEIAMIKGYGDAVYFTTYGYKEKSYQDGKEILYKYDIVSGEIEECKKFDYENGESDFRGYTVIDGDLYYKENDQVIYCNQKTGEETVIFDVDKQQTTKDTKEQLSNCWLFSDRTYLYLNNENDMNAKEEDKKLIVLDTKGNTVDEIRFSNKDWELATFYGGDDKCLFFSWAEENKQVFAYYDKEQLGKGTFETKALLEKDNETLEVKECNK